MLMQLKTMGDVLGIDPKDNAQRIHEKAVTYFSRLLQAALPEARVAKNLHKWSGSHFPSPARLFMPPTPPGDIIVQTPESMVCVEIKLTLSEDFLEPPTALSISQQVHQFGNSARSAPMVLLTNMVVPERMKEVLSDYGIRTVDFDLDTAFDAVNSALRTAVLEGLRNIGPSDVYEPSSPSIDNLSNAELYGRFFTSELIPAVELRLLNLRSQYHGGDNYVRFKRVGKYQRIYYSVVFRADNVVETELYIDTGNRDLNLKHLYTDLASQTDRVRKLLPYEVRPDHVGAKGTMRACRLGVRLPGTVHDTKNWPRFAKFALDAIEKLESECGPWIDAEYRKSGW